MVARLHPKSSAGRVAPAKPELLTVTRPELLVDGSDAEFRTLIHRSMSFSRWISTVRDGFGALIGISAILPQVWADLLRLVKDGDRRSADALYEKVCKPLMASVFENQQPKRLVPQLGVVVSTTSGHSPPSDAPWYIPSSDLLSCPQAFLTCMR